MSAPPAPSCTLHSYWRSSCSYRVRIALAAKGIPYATSSVHLAGGAQFGPAFAAVSPTQRVPALEIDGLTLLQSPAILEYLEETRPEPPLLPREAGARAHVRALCALVGCDIQPLGNLAVLKRVAGALPEGAPPEERAAARDAWARHWISEGFAALEALLARGGGAGRFCVGDELTLADVFLEPQGYNAARFGVDMAPFPTIARVLRNLAEHPAVRAAHPAAQPDAE
jgi:maleylacetoacetate isomerase